MKIKKNEKFSSITEYVEGENIEKCSRYKDIEKLEYSYVDEGVLYKNTKTEFITKSGKVNCVGVLRIEEKSKKKKELIVLAPKGHKVLAPKGHKIGDENQTPCSYANDIIELLKAYYASLGDRIKDDEVHKEKKFNGVAINYIVAKFDKVFEWALGVYFGNQISLGDNNVCFKSNIINKDNKNIDDINDKKYWAYEWMPYKKNDKNSGKQVTQEWQFTDDKKINIPDIVIDDTITSIRDEEINRKVCIIIDAKYYGSDITDNGNDNKKITYKLPGNESVYKQYFYQEQFARIYKKELGESDQEVYIYNVFVLPLNQEDSFNDNLFDIRAVINFDFAQKRSIAVFMVDVDKLISLNNGKGKETINANREDILYSLYHKEKLKENNLSKLEPYIV